MGAAAGIAGGLRVWSSSVLTLTKEVRLSDTLMLSTMAHGAIDERFGVELQRVLDNIADPNTDWRKKRSIQMTITFQPRNAERDLVDVRVACATKTVGLEPVETPVFIGKMNGQLVAVEHDPRQMGLGFDSPAPKPAPQLVAANFGGGKE